MKKALLILFVLLPFSIASIGTTVVRPIRVPLDPSMTFHSVYDELNLGSFGLSKEVYEYALHGWQKQALRPILSIADMSQPSSRKRLYVIDLSSRKLLFNTYVAHGQHSGDLVATKFSNTNSSFQTSLGFYQTLGTYYGKHGLSLKIKGLEKDFNDNAFNRSIVLHGADYVCEDFIRKTGRLGRSQGCPAVENGLSKTIIQAVKDGSCLFIYSPNPDYLKKSTFLL